MKAADHRSLLRPLDQYRDREVLVAVSGGADSVALLRALVQNGARPSAAHLDHALRDASAQDAASVAELADTLGVPFVTQRLDVRAVAERRGWNLEEAARTLRYSFLTRTARQLGLQTILTAHTRPDQAETVMWQLLRGEAMLRGMPARRGHLERPWLEVGRHEILEYLEATGQPWSEDESNLDHRYTRNWLRHAVLPLLHTRFPGLERSLARLARFQAQDDEELQRLAGAVTAHAPLARQPLAVLRRYARTQLQDQEVHASQLEEIAGAISQGGTHHLTLPGGALLSVTGGRIVLPGAEVAPVPDFVAPVGWTLRHPRPGDRLRRSGGSRKLSDVLSDLKVPRSHRPGLWLLAEDRPGEPGAAQWVGLPDPHVPLWALGAAEQAGLQPTPDADWQAMNEALTLARQAGRAGEVPVGAVVLHGGRVVAGAANRSLELNDMTRHAELEALRAASAVVGPYLGDCTLVVTLEPCPMCLGAALEARIGRVVYGAANPRAGALGGVSDLLAQHWGHRPEVRGGVGATEAARLLRQMFAEVRTQRGEAGAG